MKKNHHSLLKKIGLTVSIGLVAVASLAQQSGKSIKVCKRVFLERQPLWISSAAWISSLSSIAVIDPLRNEILLVSPDGKFLPFDQRKLVESPAEMVPATIDTTGDGYLLQMVNHRLFWLDGKLKPLAVGDLVKASTGPKGGIGSTYDWVTAGNYMLAFGSVKTSQRPRYGFYRTPLKALSAVDFLYDFDQIDYYLLGYSYLSELGRDGYFVLMDKQASIYRVPADGGGRVAPLNAFPENYRLIPPIPTVSTGPNTDELLFKGIEELTIPVGLYGGKDGFLYLLTREPREKKSGGGTKWLLHQIDPGTDKVLGRMELPTTINHLTIVPTEQNWYIFEKGPVLSPSQQRIASMLVIPSELIHSRTLPVACQAQTK